MGACARGARDGGGRVVGVIPRFLVSNERPPDEPGIAFVETMHDRKRMLYEKADAFVVLPGGVGTLEEAIEMLTWRRLGLHGKPMVFYNPNCFWDPLFNLFRSFFAGPWLTT
jgi:uncharacterized protein (TIGR00730 family)